MLLEDALKYFGIKEVPVLKELSLLYIKKRNTLQTEEEIEECIEAYETLQDENASETVVKDIVIKGKKISLKSLITRCLGMKDDIPTHVESGILFREKGALPYCAFKSVSGEEGIVALPEAAKLNDIIVAPTTVGVRKIILEIPGR